MQNSWVRSTTDQVDYFESRAAVAQVVEQVFY